MDEGSLRCRDPKIYCKYRSACTVHFLTRRRRGLDDGPPGAAAGEGTDDRPAGGPADGTH